VEGRRDYYTRREPVLGGDSDYFMQLPVIPQREARTNSKNTLYYLFYNFERPGNCLAEIQAFGGCLVSIPIMTDNVLFSILICLPSSSKSYTDFFTSGALWIGLGVDEDTPAGAPRHRPLRRGLWIALMMVLSSQKGEEESHILAVSARAARAKHGYRPTARNNACSSKGTQESTQSTRVIW
jgi:hypothetical protein